MGFQVPITIKKAIEGIQSNAYVLPAIQREFVWKPDQIEKFFDSLLKEYPIGIFLFWSIDRESLQRFQFYRFMDHFHQRDYRHNEPIDLVGEHQATAVLDGQQRLTALNIGLRGWYAHKLPYYHWSNNSAFPRQFLYLDLLRPSEDPEKAFEFRLLRDEEADNSARLNGHYWFPVAQILEFTGMEQAFSYCVDHGLVREGDKFPYNTLFRLWNLVHNDPIIHYFLEEEQNLDKVLNIFIRVNSGGTELSYSDLLLSIAIAQWEELDAREEIYGLVENLNSVGEGFDFSKDFILKACLVLSDVPKIEFKVDNFNRENMVMIEKAWPEIARALRLTTALVSSWGYSRDTLVSANALIPIAYFVYKSGNPTSVVESDDWKKQREVMRMWLIVALLKRSFSGQSDTVLRAIRNVMRPTSRDFPAEEIGRVLVESARSPSFDDAELEGLLGYQYSQRYTFSVLALLYPWLKYDQHFHVDHIFPRAMFTQRNLTKLGIPEDRWGEWLDHVNDLANLQLLQGLRNQEKSDREFEAWLESHAPEPAELAAYLKEHMIPKVDLGFRNFPEFRAAREKLLTDRLREVIGISRQV